MKMARWRLHIFISILSIFADFLHTKVSLITDFFATTFVYICKRSSLRSHMLAKRDFLSNFQTLCICQFLFQLKFQLFYLLLCN